MVETATMRVARTRWLVALSLVLVLATACRGGHRGTIEVTGEPKPTDIPQNIPDVLAADEGGDFTTLLELVDKAGLEEALSGTGPMTLFAPDNDAFDAAFTDAELAELGEQTAELQTLLERHVTPKDVAFTRPSYVTEVTGGGTTALLVDGRTDVADAGLVIVTSPTPLTMLDGTRVLALPDKTLTFAAGKAKVIEADIQAPNGFIQVIDQVLKAPSSTPST
jgi:uncharacterized surface protein with fasciclin (FAS1) repeats